MYITYSDKKVEKLCTNLKDAKRKMPSKTVDKLFKAINFIESASSLKAIIEYRPYRFHDLDGDRCGQYAIDIGPKIDGYRLILMFNENKNEVFNNSIEIVDVIVKEMGNHYD